MIILFFHFLFQKTFKDLKKSKKSSMLMISDSTINTCLTISNNWNYLYSNFYYKTYQKVNHLFMLHLRKILSLDF